MRFPKTAKCEVTQCFHADLQLACRKPKYGLFSTELLSLYNSSFQNCQNLCSCPVFGSEFSKKTGSSVTFQLS